MFAAAVLAAQLTISDIVALHPATGSPPSAFTWSPDGSRYIYSLPPTREHGPPTLRVRDVRTGSDRLLLAAKSESRGSRSRAIAQIVWSHDSRHIAFLDNGSLHVAGADGGHDTVLANDADDPQWSPDDRRIAYVHDNDLYDVAVNTHRATRLTFDGSPMRINGDPDWLYSEEMLSVQHAYRWSPNGAAIAYLSFDESPVTPFPIQNYLPTINTVEEQRYPLAGRKNPRVQLRYVNVRTHVWHTLYDGGPHDDYVLDLDWTPDGSRVVDEILDRSQKHFRLVAFTLDGVARTILHEDNADFVDVDDVKPPIWLDHGRQFLWISQRGDVQALYRVDTATGAARRITGSYPVAAVERVDERDGVAYVSAYYHSRRDVALVRVPLRGGAPTNLTPGDGSHRVAMPERGNWYVETSSSFNSPPVIALRNLRGGATRVLFRTPDLSRFDLGTVRRLEILSKWGMLDAQLTVPAGFDPAKKYPVVVEAYGGPLPVSWGVPSNDSWKGLWPFLLAQHGFLSFTVDGPASNNDRTANARRFYKHMGVIAMAGQLAGLAWLKDQTYVDASHIGLFGWSYGGYLTAFTLTHAPDAYAAGIAGAPPADWRFYDTGYTERYMGMPQHNAAAYQATSVLPAASKLKAKLLILQGTSDDNVHLMNSISLLEAFMNAGKHVEYYVYPGARHGVTGIAAQRDRYARMLAWWERTLH
ncbi:MAG TPA: DPP IV N-terminal domain-containing protein [Candidatus Aquilonibacter sp.]